MKLRRIRVPAEEGVAVQWDGTADGAREMGEWLALVPWISPGGDRLMFRTEKGEAWLSPGDWFVQSEHVEEVAPDGVVSRRFEVFPDTPLNEIAAAQTARLTR